MDRLLVIRFARLEQRRRKLRLIRRVGVMLGFEAESAVFFRGDAAVFDRAVEEVAGIELDAGIGGVDFHDSPGARRGESRDMREAGAVLVNDEAVVISARIARRLRDRGSDARGAGEVERGVFDARDRAGGQQSARDRRRSSRYARLRGQ